MLNGISGMSGMGGMEFGPDAVWMNEAGNVISSPFGQQGQSMAASDPVSIMGTFLIIIGVALIIAGAVLAVYLKKRSK